MATDNSRKDGFFNLRKRAELWLSGSEQYPSLPLTLEETHKLVHELHTHQIELELQNDILRRLCSQYLGGKSSGETSKLLTLPEQIFCAACLPAMKITIASRHSPPDPFHPLEVKVLAWFFVLMES
ncbi:hypothetical protein [Desulfopila aestuarii]|uniref:Uncharacterized protein n=1 Tax=Desulfopila aestuarii DSM 18488 TaxID=1121416 RepID=A0A1M7YKN1_9BACT|nr:hypothetical protein [Desulfopila aestuarii]SHO53190.1 hypothetical protein SAMN02745220_04996 [Desulfopila aestuarii DSM 18488]